MLDVTEQVFSLSIRHYIGQLQLKLCVGMLASFTCSAACEWERRTMSLAVEWITQEFCTIVPQNIFLGRRQESAGVEIYSKFILNLCRSMICGINLGLPYSLPYHIRIIPQVTINNHHKCKIKTR